MTVTFFVVDDSVIMGMNLRNTMAEQLYCQVSSSGSPFGPSFLLDFTYLLHGSIGRAKGSEHKVPLHESVVPLQPVPVLPLVVRHKVTTKLRKLKQRDII